MTELGGYVFSALREGEVTLYRGSGDGLEPILLVAPVGEYPTRESLERLEHEYALRAVLDSDWAARPVALAPRDGRTTLVLADPGGEPLDRLLRGPLAMTPFLRIAISLATALRRMHGRGLIHKDIRPANFLVDRVSGGAWLTGFGIASRRPREPRVPEPPEEIAGTLAYMAPEQTGRMNRSVDSRSDLYALGVTFYELLTGTLPFTATDPMEWVHCHIARQALSPDERVAGIPGPVAAIVMKLLAKTAEDRYQTAAGVEADLRRCLAEWEPSGRIDRFQLGTEDTSDRLLIQERLYGREREVGALLAAFDRVFARTAPELVLVSGYSGVGKSSVVNELHRVLVPPRGLFASGKFDQYKRDVPYATLAEAFQGLVHALLGKSEAELGRWREALCKAVGPYGQLVVNLVPDLERVIGAQPAAPELAPRDSRHVFEQVIRRFVGVFAHREHPLVLFLDDLQWLDAATLDLLQHLLLQSEVPDLLLVGAYRDNEVGPEHPLARRLDAIRAAGARVTEIPLAPLALGDVTALVGDSLHRGDASPLAKVVHDKTAGNPFFAIQFLGALADDGLIAFDHDARRWTWDLARIAAKGFTDNVVALMIARIRRLPAPARDTMRMLACLGHTAGAATLAMLLDVEIPQVHAALCNAVDAGLVARQDDGRYTFLHDRIQEAAYGFVAEDDRPGVHLRIGRLLAARTPADRLDEAVFEIVNQINRGSHLVTDRDELDRIAELNLIAGRRAQAAPAHVTALAFLAAGEAQLGDEGWQRRRPLAFQLAFELAESDFLTGDLASADDRLTKLAARAEGLVERAAITCQRIALFMALARADRAIEIALEYLRHAGIAFAPHPSDEDVQAEYDAMMRKLGDRAIEDLIDLPESADPVMRGTLDVLAAVLPPAWFSDPLLPILLTGRIVSLSIEYGNCAASAYGYVMAGMKIGPQFGDYHSGDRFGELALELVEKPGLGRFKPGVYLTHGLHILPWTRGLDGCIELLQRGFEAAEQIGDLTFAVYILNGFDSCMLTTGAPLADAERASRRALDYARNVHYEFVAALVHVKLRLARMLRGDSPRFGSLTGDDFDEEEFERAYADLPVMALPMCWYWVRCLQARFLAGDAAGAVVAAINAAPHAWVSTAFREFTELHFYGVLARAQCHDTADEVARRSLRGALGESLDLLATWGRIAPETLGSRHALAAAEVARVDGREREAMDLYEQAIRSARSHGLPHVEGLAFELAARFYAARGFETIAHAYLRNARYGYLRWGADGKVRQLEKSHPQLLEDRVPPPPTALFGAPIVQLDIAAVVKASQAISGEIVLDRLIETLMTIALQAAGAERGLLIIRRGDGLRIEAEARTDRETVAVTLRQDAVTPSDLPGSVLRTVMRTEQSVLLDDALADNPFSADEYIRHERARSVLCLPLVKQAELIALLYLENNLASHAFTPARIAVLNLLSSQAAISLENARLYAGLMDENRERARAEADLRRSEAWLAQSQEITHTGSWRWKIGTGELAWSLEHFRIFGLDPAAAQPSFPAFIDKVAPDDRAALEQVLDRAVRQRGWFQHEYRIVLPDGSVRHLQSVGHPDTDPGHLEFIGTVMDITERKRAEEALRNAQADLARVTRLTTMGELAASLAHEINQPLAAIAANGSAGIRWLGLAEPDLDEARAALARIVQDGARAGDVIRGLRALAKKTGPELARLDVDHAIHEVLALTRGELQRQGVALHTQLGAGDRPVFADRVQLQQVLMNLILNGIESMRGGSGRPKVLAISSEPIEPDGVLIAVADTGPGLDPAMADRIFEPFFTTKPDGIGMGLSICRSIITAHGGRLWASPGAPCGTVFRFTVPRVPLGHPSLRPIGI